MYRCLHVYSVGFHDIMKELTKHARNKSAAPHANQSGGSNSNKSPEKVLSRVWLLFMQLLENHNRTQYHTAIEECSKSFRVNFRNMRHECEKDLRAMKTKVRGKQFGKKKKTNFGVGG